MGIIVLVVFFSWLTGSAEVFGADTAGVTPNPQLPTQALPHCATPAETAQVVDLITNNSKTPFKYEGYRKVFKSESQNEIVARLVYAETLAAQCPQQNEKVASQILRVVAQRVEKRQGKYLDVVFERDQFASSLNTYSTSRYKDFLCPQDPGLWNMVYQKVARAFESRNKTKDSSYHYFLYKHDKRWRKEPISWKQFSQDMKQTSPELQECIRVFRNPAWK